MSTENDCEEHKDKALSQDAVSGSILMNILEDDYELNKQFHEALRESIYSFSVANYNETMTFENWLTTYYY